jgi:hypothetical protein
MATKFLRISLRRGHQVASKLTNTTPVGQSAPERRRAWDRRGGRPGGSGINVLNSWELERGDGMRRTPCITGIYARTKRIQEKGREYVSELETKQILGRDKAGAIWSS